MKTFIIVIVLLFVFLIIAKSQTKSAKSCVTVSNYNLLRSSELSKLQSKYDIEKLDNELAFRSKSGYCHFILKVEQHENEKSVRLIGLDGYGLRDKEFNRYICKLVHTIKESKPSTN